MMERARQVLGLRPRKGRSQRPYSQQIKMTPVMAKRVLDELNTDNRAPKTRGIELLRRDILAGRWVSVPHQGIAFMPDGTLGDGQNRLFAVVAANVAVLIYVSFNVERLALDVTDIGTIRSAADSLSRTGKHGVVTKTDMSTLNAMLRGMGSTKPLSRAEEGDAIDRHRDAITFAADALGTHNRIKGITTGTTLGVLARAWYSQDKGRLREFAVVLTRLLSDGDGDDGARLLIQYLLKGKIRDNSTGTLLHARYTHTERGLKAFLGREKLTKLFPVSEEQFPLPEELEDQETE